MEEQANRQETATEDYRVNEARERRKRRIREMQRRKRKQQELRRKIQIGAPIAAGVLILCIAIGVGITTFSHSGDSGKKKDSELKASREQEAGNSEKNLSESVTKIAALQSMEEELRAADKMESGGIAAASVLRAQNTGIPTENGSQTISEVLDASIPSVVYSAKVTANTLQLGESLPSRYAILIDLDSQTILAQKSANDRISPASMTKILTVLVAAEHLEDMGDLEDTFTITREIKNYVYNNDCSNVGFVENETVTVEDLFYGAILPSGADAALGLAEYVAGSHEAFVELMNEKLEELELSDTAHMTNCVGIYNENHYCTTYDMAMIMEAAMNNELCRKVMSTHTYTTSPTTQHPRGIEVSNLFLRRIEDSDTGGKVVCAKTGYVRQSGNCAASYAIDYAGKEYICVTVNAYNNWRCIYDHADLYKRFATG